ncbi:MAG: hypothetical protein ABI867_01670 [Kofleriaceae bacterium]
MVARWCVLLVAACGGGSKARGPDDAARLPIADGAGSAADAASTIDAPPGSTGELAVRVEWKNVAAALRGSPGRTPCNTPRLPALAPTTMWGIPDAFVVVEGGAPPPADARIVLADCALHPRVVAAATSIVIASAVDRPAKLVLTKQGTLADRGAFHPGEPRTIQLPIAGHAVSIALEPGAVYLLATDAPEPETAWIVAGSVYVTDATGVATIKKLPLGPRTVTAWVPARAGQPAKLADATATVAVEPAELAIDLAVAK